MTSHPQVVLHDITDPKSWPKEATSISRLFTRSLPKELVSEDVAERLSPFARAVYRDAVQSRLLYFEEEDMDTRLGRSVVDVVDTVLTLVSVLRSLKSFDNDHHGPRPTQSVWTSLIVALGLASSEEAHALTDMPFLMPRLGKSTVHDVHELEGKAAILLSAKLESEAVEVDDEQSGGDDHAEQSGSEVNEEDSEEEVEEQKSEGEDEMSYEGKDEEESTIGDGLTNSSDSSDSTTSEVSLISLDLPFDAHVLPGRGIRVDCHLPVVCVADEENIQPLMISILFQRLVLGIVLPIVGFSIPKGGTLAIAVIGWTTQSDVYDQPFFHFASSKNLRNPSPSMGLFELTSPGGALHFAQLILEMGPQYSSILEQAIAPCGKDICWRLDHLNFDHCSPKTDSSNLIDRLLYDSLPESSVDTLASFLSDDFQVNASGHMPSSSLKPPSHSKASSKKKETVKSADAPASTSSTTKSRSASSFAKLTPNNAIQEQRSGTDLWLWERSTLRIGCSEASGAGIPHELGQQINEMVKEYNSLTGFYWPEHWTNLSDMPPCDRIYNSLKQQLFEEYTGKETALVRGPLAKDDRAYDCLESRFSSFLLAVSDARCRASKKTGSNEADMRHAWDSLFKSFCCEADDATSPFLLLERSILLPKNEKVSRGLLYPELEQAILLERLLSLQHASAWSAKDDIKALALDALLGAAKALVAIKARVANQVIVPAGERADEPRSAKVDSMCCLEIEVNLEPEHTTKLPVSHQPSSPSASSLAALKSDQAPAPAHSWDSVLLTVPPKSCSEATCKGEMDAPATSSSQPPLPPIPESDNNTGDFMQRLTHWKCFMCRQVTRNLDDERPLVKAPALNLPLARSLTLMVPHIVAENKRDNVAEHQAFHQCQMYCVSTLEFLAKLGIVDFPIFGIITTHTTGSIIMAWKSSKSALSDEDSTPVRHNIIIDRNLQRFDLTSVAQAYQFVICLNRIYHRRAKLEKLLKDSKLKLAEILCNPTFQGWTMPPKVEHPPSQVTSEPASSS